MRLSCCLGEGGIRQRFRRGGHFFRGTHTSQVGGVGEASENVVFFFKNLKKELPPQKNVPKKWDPGSKGTFRRHVRFSGEKKLLPFHLLPEKNKKNTGEQSMVES